MENGNMWNTNRATRDSAPSPAVQCYAAPASASRCRFLNAMVPPRVRKPRPPRRMFAICNNLGLLPG